MSWATKSNGKTATMWPIEEIIAGKMPPDKMAPGDNIIKEDVFVIAGILDKKKKSYVRLELSKEDTEKIVKQLTDALSKKLPHEKVK